MDARASRPGARAQNPVFGRGAGPAADEGGETAECDAGLDGDRGARGVCVFYNNGGIWRYRGRMEVLLLLGRLSRTTLNYNIQ